MTVPYAARCVEWQPFVSRLESVCLIGGCAKAVLETVDKDVPISPAPQQTP